RNALDYGRAVLPVDLDAVDAEGLVRRGRLRQPREQGQQQLPRHHRRAAHVDRVGAGQAEVGQKPDLLQERWVQRQLEADVTGAEAVGEGGLLRVDGVDGR